MRILIYFLHFASLFTGPKASFYAFSFLEFAYTVYSIFFWPNTLTKRLKLSKEVDSFGVGNFVLQ
jgi:hypothetical protein